MIIEGIYAFISVDEKGDEGICAFQVGGTWIPLVAADETRMKQYKSIAQSMARSSGMKIKLIRLTTREELETIHGTDA